MASPEPLAEPAVAASLARVRETLQQWALEGPPRNPRAAAGLLAADLDVAVSASGVAAEEFAARALAQEMRLNEERAALEVHAEEQRAELLAELAAREARAEAGRAEVVRRAERELASLVVAGAAKRALLRVACSEAAERLRACENQCVADVAAASQRCEDLQAESGRLQASVASQQAEVQALRRRNSLLSERLLSVLPPVSAVCRVRPLESYAGSEAAAAKSSLGIEGGEVSVEDAAGRQRRFKVDRVLDGRASQEDLWEAAEPWVENVKRGGCSCVFAYGATGAGKTHSMLGAAGGSQKSGCHGLAQHALQRLIEEGCGEVRLSMVEVYCEQIRDLLAPPTEVAGPRAVQCSRRDAQGRMLLDCAEATVDNLADAWEVLRRGFRGRATEGTLCNETSSRSHVVLTVRTGSGAGGGGGRLVLVDLAGSENVQRSGADEGGKLLMEAKSINRSLSALADVVEATARQQTFIPYRNSRLTMLLEDALSASKVLLLVHVSPLAMNSTDTAHSLQFASHVKGIDFGSQRAKQEQEDRLRAAQVRSQQEVRQVQQQLDQERGQREKELRDLREKEQRAAQELKEQLRDRQREVVREQGLRAKAEQECARLQRLLSSSGGGVPVASAAPVLGSPETPAGVGCAVPAARPRRFLQGGRPPTLSRSLSEVVLPDGDLTPRSSPPPLAAEVAHLRRGAGRPRTPLSDRTNCCEASALAKNTDGNKPVADSILASPAKAKAPIAAQKGDENAGPDWQGFGEGLPGAAETMPSPVPFEGEVAAAEENATRAAGVGAPWSSPDSKEHQVRSVLRPTPTDFKARLLRRQLLGGTTAPREGRRVRFAEEEPTQCSPPRWYLDFLQAEHLQKAEHAHAGGASGGGSAGTRRVLTPPMRRRLAPGESAAAAAAAARGGEQQRAEWGAALTEGSSHGPPPQALPRWRA